MRKITTKDECKQLQDQTFCFSLITWDHIKQIFLRL